MRFLRNSPGPHHTGLGERQGELGPTFDLTHSLPIEPLNVLWDITALAAAPSELPKVPVAPGEHQACWEHGRERERPQVEVP